MEFANMNEALFQRLSTLVSIEHYDLYNSKITQNPNRTIHDIVNYFYKEYDIRDEME